jgi:hypothetical protein
MTNIFWILGNAFLIILILLRVPRARATFTNINKNPKALDIAIPSLVVIFLVGTYYLNVYS